MTFGLSFLKGNAGKLMPSICGICERPLGRNQARIRIVEWGAAGSVAFHRYCFEALRAKAEGTFTKLECPNCHARFQDTESGECLRCGRWDLHQIWGLLEPHRTCFLCGLEIYRSIHSYLTFGSFEAHGHCCHKICVRKAHYDG